MAGQRYCPQCGESNDAEARFCRSCGHEFERLFPAAGAAGLPAISKTKGSRISNVAPYLIITIFILLATGLLFQDRIRSGLLAAAATPTIEMTTTAESQVSIVEVTVIVLPTDSPTKRPLPTDTATPTATHLPSPTVTSSPSPSVTPLPTATRTPTAVVVACGYSASSSFANTYQTYRTRLGCPTSNAWTTWSAKEAFERGYMFWRQDTDRIYVLYNGGTWASYNDIWVEGDPDFSCGTQQSPPTPRRGFGKIWCTYNSVQQGLGNAVEGEAGENTTLQSFENGFIWQTSAGRFVMFFDGSWNR